jgi:ribonuclease Z
MAEPDDARAVSPGAPAAKLSAKERFVVHTLSGYKIEGVSVGGQETCIVLPQLKLAFDSGRCPQRCVYADTMCLSHTHMDHVGGAGFYIATRSLISLPPPTIVLPASRTTAFAAFVDAMKALDGSDMPHVAVGLEPANAQPAELNELDGEHGVEPGTVSTGYRSRTTTTPTTTPRADTTSEDAVTNGAPTEHRVSKRLVVRAFTTTHPTPSQGYVLYGTKEKLKTDYIGLPPAEIKALKASGVAITDTVEVPEVAFTGDTTIDWVDRATGSGSANPSGEENGAVDGASVDAVAADALRARLLICECTFVDDRCSAEDARRYGHTHIDDLVARADAFRETGAILLIHFSARYKAEEVREALAARLPEALKAKVTPMLEGFG